MTDRVTVENRTPKINRHSSVDEAHLIGRWLREPLWHFLVLGAALFAAYTYLRDDQPAGQQQIVVSAGKIEHLAALFTRTWQRPPTREELEGLVNDYVREEAAYREGLALGLDQNDTIIRRRLRQKLDFVAEDLIRMAPPTDDELASYLQEHPDDFRVDPRLSFRQVFFNPERHRDDVEQLVSDLVTRLRTDPAVDSQEQGDRTLLEHQYDNLSLREVHSLFGEEFASSVVDLEPGNWQGPVRSAYGLHAVFIDEISPGRLPQLDEVREAVRREWENARRQRLTEEYYRELLKKFNVAVEWPEPVVMETAQ